MLYDIHVYLFFTIVLLVFFFQRYALVSHGTFMSKKNQTRKGMPP